MTLEFPCFWWCHKSHINDSIFAFHRYYLWFLWLHWCTLKAGQSVLLHGPTHENILLNFPFAWISLRSFLSIQPFFHHTFPSVLLRSNCCVSILSYFICFFLSWLWTSFFVCIYVHAFLTVADILIQFEMLCSWFLFHNLIHALLGLCERYNGNE